LILRSAVLTDMTDRQTDTEP